MNTSCIFSKQEAIDSGLFGCNAEETTVLVDYKDKDRLRAFLSVCELTNESLYVLKEHIKLLDDLSDDQETLFDDAQKDFVRGVASPSKTWDSCV
jgi:hypothetical protein